MYMQNILQSPNIVTNFWIFKVLQAELLVWINKQEQFKCSKFDFHPLDIVYATKSFLCYRLKIMNITTQLHNVRMEIRF